MQALVVDDLTDTWSHGVDRFGTSGETFTCERLEVVERGPLRLRVRTHGTLRQVDAGYRLPSL